MAEPLWQWSASGLAGAIRSRRCSSEEVVRAHLERIAAVNPEVNAVTLVLEEEALVAAKLADEEVASGAELGPLHGVPITVKENVDVVGTPTTHGIVMLSASMPNQDAPVVAHLRKEGAIVIGRTNLPDFGLRYHTDNDLHGATRNPWDPSRTPGGSSGGEAAAIATGMSPLGVGNDMGGSLRYPAQCCGIASIRPSFGRVSRTLSAIFSEPPMFFEQVGAVNGPMARRVKDLRLALSVMSQPDLSDPCWLPAPRLGAQATKPVSVALAVDPGGWGCSPVVAAGVRRAAEVLAEAGYAIEEVEPPAVEESAEVIQRIIDTEVQSYLPAMRTMVSEDAATVLDSFVGGTVPDPNAYMKAIGRRHAIAARWNLFMQRYPLVLGPVSTQPAFEVGHDLAGPEASRAFIRSVTLTEICNLLGLPSVAVPVQVADGLPQGVQLIAARYHEDLCFDAAEAIEARVGVFTPVDPRAASSRFRRGPAPRPRTGPGSSAPRG